MARLPYRTLSRACLCGAGLAVSLLAAFEPQSIEPPSAPERQQMLDRMREYASGYVSNLPNFVCHQVTQHFDAGKKPEHWHQRETVTTRLTFGRGGEERMLELVNGKPVKPGQIVQQPLETEGEFGVLIANIFDDDTEAAFSWSNWGELRGRKLAVFTYAVDRNHSTVSLSLGGQNGVIVPYRGEIYADPATGAVWRITNVPYDIPPAVDTRSLITTIDYDSVEIGGRPYFLPVEAAVQMDTGSRNILNKAEFRDYRKFEAESRITFSSGDEVAADSKGSGSH